MTAPVSRAEQEHDRRETRLVRAVVAEGFVNRLGFGIVTFALPLYALELGMSIAAIGLLISAKAILQPAVKPLVGWAIDRWGTRKGYLAAVVFRFLAAVALLLAFTPAALFAVRLLQGLASAASDPVSISVLAKGRSERTARRFSAVYAARDVGKVAAGVLGGLLLAVTGSFTALWVFVVVLAAIPLYVVWGFVHELPDRPQERVEVDVPEEAERILRSPRLRTIAMLGLFGGMTATMTHALFQVYASEVAGLSAGQIGLVYSLSVVALLVVGPLAGWVGDRRGHGLLASVRGVSNVVSSLVYLFAPSFAGMLAGRLVDESGKAAFRPTWGSLLAQATRRAGKRGGRTAGGLDAWLSVGEAVGPLLAGLVWDLAGVVWFLVLRAVLGLGTELVLGRKLRALLRAPEPPAPVAPRPAAPQVDTRPGPPVEVRTADPAALAAAVAHDSTSSGWRAASVLPPPEPAADRTLAQAFAEQWPQAAPEDVALAWRRAGMVPALPTPEALARRVGALDHAQRARLQVALAVLGEPLVLVVDTARVEADPVLREAAADVVERHRGRVLQAVPPQVGEAAPV